MSTSALIVTLQLDKVSALHFDQIRQQYFPQNLNFLSAHITLFHHLPGKELKAINGNLEEIAKNCAHMDVRVTGLRSLGRGVAFRLESPPLVALRSRLVQQWLPWLTPQDLQRFQPHITVQNKVHPEEARRTLALLSATFTPHTVRGTGLELWRYAGGPWEHVAEFLF